MYIYGNKVIIYAYMYIQYKYICIHTYIYIYNSVTFFQILGEVSGF